MLDLLKDKRTFNIHYDPIVRSLVELNLGMRIDRSNEEEAEIKLGSKILLFRRKMYQNLQGHFVSVFDDFASFFGNSQNLNDKRVSFVPKKLIFLF